MEGLQMADYSIISFESTISWKDARNVAQHQGRQNKIPRGLQKHVHEAKAIEDNLFLH